MKVSNFYSCLALMKYWCFHQTHRYLWHSLQKEWISSIYIRSMSYKHYPETDKTTLPSRILGLKGNIWRVSGLGYSGLFMFSSSSSTTFATLPAVIWTTCLRTRSWNGEIENEKPSKCPVHLAKTQISLRIFEVWSVFVVGMKRR